MMEKISLSEYIRKISPVSERAMDGAKKRTDSQMKPLGSLGLLETLSIRLAGMTGEIENSFEKCCTIVMAADNGICQEGVASAPVEITRIQTENIARGLTGISALSRAVGADVRVVDVGIDGVCERGVAARKIRKGTNSFLRGPAMSREDAEAAIQVGIEITEDLIRNGYTLLGTGEMGIGNTSTATAVISVLSGRDPKEITGRGAGLTDEAYLKKIWVISEGIKRNGLHWENGGGAAMEAAQEMHGAEVVLDVLSKVGGLDICALVGCYLAAAKNRTPIVIDGVISIAAALAAATMAKGTKQYMIPSHKSMEPAYQAASSLLGFHPCFDLKMRLGEGTGCPLMFHVIRSAAACLNEIATFEEQQISDAFLVDNR